MDRDHPVLVPVALDDRHRPDSMTKNAARSPRRRTGPRLAPPHARPSRRNRARCSSSRRGKAPSRSGVSGTPIPGGPATPALIRPCPAASAAQRRGRDPGLADDVRDHQANLVDEAPGPRLAGLESADQRVAVLSSVARRVAVRRVVTTADLSTLQADAQMKPGVPGREAVLASSDLRRKLGDRHLVEMTAGRHDVR